MIHTRLRLDLMVCSLSRKNQAEMEKKMTTPTFAAALHHELEEDAFRSQGEFQHVVAVVDDEVVHEDHEHRDDA